MITDEPRFCQACNRPVKGRTDKKFCDDNCRNQFNNQLKAGSNNYVRNINNALSKNRRILENIIPGGEEMIRVSKETLLTEGFSFRYHTHVYKNKKGAIYHYCYDHGYLLLDTEWYLVVKQHDH